MEMLARVFLMVLNRGVEISCVILVVLAARLLLLKFPKKYSYFLWILVAVRVIVPVEAFSLFPSFGIFNIPAVGAAQDRIVAVEEQFRIFGEEDVIADAPAGTESKEWDNVMPAGTGQENEIRRQEEKPVAKPDVFGVVSVLAPVWLLGMISLCLYSLISYVLLRKRISSAVLLRDNIYECGNIATPFVIGFFNPKIYIPFRLCRQERQYILHHENCHIRRKDYVVKLSAFLVTVVYWFNPLVWLAFFLMTRDMEMSCDEKVIMELGMDAKLNYGRLLLSFATNRRRGMAGPLAFGEGDTKKRVKNVLDIRKPRFWVVAAAVVVLIAAGVLCLTGRAEGDDGSKNSLKLNPDGKTVFVMEEELASFDGTMSFTPKVTLEGNTFSLELNPISSYLNFGTYEIEENRLTAQTSDLRYRYVFEIVDENTLRLVETDCSEEDARILKLYGDGIEGKLFYLESGSLQNQTEVSAETETFVKNWAENFCTRNGEGLVAVCEEGVWESIPFMYSESGRGFGMSSPWPWGDEPYEIRQMTEEEAVIFYYAQTSDPHIFVWREEIKFRGGEGNLLVYEENMTGVNDIRTAEEMKLLYPDGRISGTMMDYRTNGLGTGLQQNYLLGRPAVSASFSDCEEAVYSLLNIVPGDTVMTGIYELENDRRAEVVLYFTEEDEAVLVTLERINDFKDEWLGIWVPVGIEFAGHDEALIHEVMIQNTKHRLNTSGGVQNREIDMKLDETMPVYNMSEGGYIDGDFLDDFYYPYQRKLFVFPRELTKLCYSDDLEQWHQRYTLHIPAAEPGKSGNLCALITDFALKDEEVRKALEIDREKMKSVKGYEYYTFSTEEIDVLLSGDEEKITKEFASPYAIVLGKYAYSPLWLYTHTAQDYETVGITKEMVREKIGDYDALLLPSEAKAAFAAKMNEFVGEELWKVKE